MFSLSLFLPLAPFLSASSILWGGSSSECHYSSQGIISESNQSSRCTLAWLGSSNSNNGPTFGFWHSTYHRFFFQSLPCFMPLDVCVYVLNNCTLPTYLPIWCPSCNWLIMNPLLTLADIFSLNNILLDRFPVRALLTLLPSHLTKEKQ